MPDTIRLPARDATVVARSDVVVVGGGPAGLAAAVAAARNGASVTLLERYAHLGGMAAGGMVLLLDDMVNGLEITVRGLAAEIIDRMTVDGPGGHAAGVGLGPGPGRLGPLVALGRLRLHPGRAHQAHRVRDRVRPGRLEAGGHRDAHGGGRQLPPPLLVQRAGDGGEPHPGRGRGDQAGPPGDAGRRGHRRVRGRGRGARRRARPRSAPTTWSRPSSGWATWTRRPRRPTSRRIPRRRRRSTARRSGSWAARGRCGGSRRRCPGSSGATART